MKARVLFLIMLVMVLFTVSSAAGDSARQNPSMYSFAEVVQKFPEMWLSTPDKVLDVMKDYPDFVCWRSYDIIGCVSVNNKFSSEVHANFQFTSDKDDAEFVRAVFTMQIDSPEEIQSLIESFWLPGMAAANIWGGEYNESEIKLQFCSEETMETYLIPISKTDQYEYRTVTVDIGMIMG